LSVLNSLAVQGSTISVAQISLQHVFEYGQAYVALSRVCSLGGLYLIDFNPKRIRAHPKVAQFYNNDMQYLTVGPSIPFSRHSSPLDSLFQRVLQPDPDNLGYITQYAPSNRATCRKCQEKIGLNLLRMG